MSHSKRLERVPWISHIARMFLDAYLEEGMQVFEWGLGGSTMYFMDKCCDVWTVEHDANWYAEIIKLLPDIMVGHVQLVQPEPEELGSDISDPHHYRSFSISGNFKRYASVIDQYSLFDVVLVDGRARPSCLMHAKDHVAKDGLLILDNYERDYYTQRTAKYFLDWEYAIFYGLGPYITWPWKTMYWRNTDASC